MGGQILKSNPAADSKYFSHPNSTFFARVNANIFCGFKVNFLFLLDYLLSPTRPRRGLKGLENDRQQHVCGLGCNKGPRHRVPLHLVESGRGSEGS